MRRNHERSKVAAGVAVALHVEPHQEGVQRGEGDAVGGLVVGIGSGGQPGGDAVAAQVGHLLHSHRHHQVVRAGSHHHVRRPHHRTAGSACGFNLERFDTGEAGKIRHQCGQVFLLAQTAGEHVARKESVGALDPGIGQRRLHGFHRQLAQGLLPVLAHRSLPNADNADWTHLLSLQGEAIRGESFSSAADTNRSRRFRAAGRCSPARSARRCAALAGAG